LLFLFRRKNLHVAAVLAADFVKRAADLAQREVALGDHQYGENVAVVDDGLFELFKHGRPATMVFFQQIPPSR
jgi:hypothetical protein